MNGVAAVDVAVKCLNFIRNMAAKCYSCFTSRRACCESTFNLVAYKYYDKVCAVRRILHLVRAVNEDDMSNLCDINRAICGELHNLHMCDHVPLGLNDVMPAFGPAARRVLINMESGFAKLDEIGVGEQFSYSIDSSEVRSVCNAIEKNWDALLTEVSKRMRKRVSEIEQDLWDKHHLL